MTNKILEIKDFSFSFGKTNVIKELNLSIDKGEFIAVIGPNGGGKTTIAKAVLGLHKNYEGIINFKRDLVIGYVPQKESFIKDFPISVFDVVLTGSLGRKIRPSYKFYLDKKLLALKQLENLSIEHLKNKPISKLSGGELQKVLIARALVNRPNFLILDEPASNIDSSSKIEIFNYLKKLNKTMTILTISHNINLVFKYASRLVVINKGLLYTGTDKNAVLKLL